MRYYLLLMLGVSLLMSGGCVKSAPLDPGSVQIKFGEMKKNNKGRFVVSEEKTDFFLVPLETKFGFYITAPGRFSHYVIWHLAAPAEGNIGSLKYVDDSKKILKSKVFKSKNWGNQFFWCTSYADSVGAERMDLYVNDVLMKTVNFRTAWKKNVNRAAYDVDNMPIGLKIEHSPETITKVCRTEGSRNYFCYGTKVTNTSGKELTVERIHAGSGNTYGAKEFKKWYSSSGVLKSGQTVYDPKSWSWYSNPKISKNVKWTYIAKDKDGKYYKGEGVVRINPKD